MFARQDNASISHSRHLLGLIQQTLDEAELRLEQLDAIAVVRGPGSFTGLRIGIAVAQGLAFGHQIPVIPVSSLAAVAMNAKLKFNKNALSVDAVLATLDARMSELYCGWYDLRGSLPQLIGRERVLKPSELSQVGRLHLEAGSLSLISLPADPISDSLANEVAPALLMVGEGLSYQDQITPPFSHWISLGEDLTAIGPDACAVVPLAEQAFLSKQGIVQAEQLIPSYLRDNVTS